jgi:hypothetical protein
MGSILGGQALGQAAPPPHHIAIFVPLYLDSAFDAANNYRFDKSFPKYINQGLEFYEGAQLALDSLRSEGSRLEVQVYDTRSTRTPLAQVLRDPGFQNTELIIGHVTNADMRLLAEVALHRKIPFINVNFPNDGGITGNPDLVLLNSTIKTHCEAIYRLLQKRYATSPILLISKKGAMEDRLKKYFNEIEKSTASVPLNLRLVSLDEPFTDEQLLSNLDSNRQNVLVVASLDENFAKRLCLQLAAVSKTYSSTVFGMPTWDNITDFFEPEYGGVDIIYTTPFYMNPADTLVKSIQQYFRNKFFSRPSDMVFRGYETTYRFSKLLMLHGTELNGSIGERKFKVFNDFDIEPVFLDKQHMTLDYFENKKIHFIKISEGSSGLLN